MLQQIKKAILQDPIVLAAPLQTRLENRPFTQTILSPQGFSLSTIQKVALVILGIPALFGFLISLLSGQWVLLLITAVLVLMVAMVRWIIKLRSEMAWIVTWYYDSVEVEDGRYGKYEHWVEPLSAFTGIKREFGLLPGSGKNGPNRKVHGLLLVHPNPDKSILIHANHQPIKEETVTYYKRQLNKRVISG